MSRIMRALFELVESKRITVNNLLSEFKVAYPDLAEEKSLKYNDITDTDWLMKSLRDCVESNGDGVLALNQSGKEQLEIFRKEAIQSIVEQQKQQVITQIKELLGRNETAAVHHLLAVYVQSFHTFQTLGDTKEVLIYNESSGVYEYNGESLIANECEKILEQLGYKHRCTNHLIEEVIGHIRRSTEVMREAFDSDINIINLKNGLLDLASYELKPHSHHFLSLIQIPVKFDKDAKCPKIETFLSQIFSAVESQIPIVQELAGYLLYKSYPIQKAVLMWGYGANGKSTLMKLLTTFIGQRNTTAQSLQDLLVNRFTKAELYGKMLNACFDISSRALTDTGNFKGLVGGKDLISGEKKFKNPFYFFNFSKLIFSANIIPRTEDDTDAFYRRWVILSFPNKFEGSADDKTILDKLTSDEELSGFLNYAIEGLKRLNKNHDFSYSTTTDQMRIWYTRMSNPIKSFIDEMTELSSESEIPKTRLYDAYVDYCRKNKLAVMDSSVFGRVFKKYVVGVFVSRPTMGGVRTYCWKGIRFKTGEEIFDEQQNLNSFIASDIAERKSDNIDHTLENGKQNETAAQETRDTDIKMKCEICGKPAITAIGGANHMMVCGECYDKEMQKTRY